MNLHIIVGNLGNDPELRRVGAKDLAVTSLRVATREYRGETEWHHVDVFGQDAEFACKFAKKGDRVAVSGPRRSRIVTNPDGSEKVFYSIKCDMGKFELLTPKKEKSEGAGF